MSDAPYVAPPPSEYDDWTLFHGTTAICPNCSEEADPVSTDCLGDLLTAIDNHKCEETGNG